MGGDRLRGRGSFGGKCGASRCYKVQSTTAFLPLLYLVSGSFKYIGQAFEASLELPVRRANLQCFDLNVSTGKGAHAPPLHLSGHAYVEA